MDKITSKAITGCEDAKTLLTNIGIKAMQKQAGFIPNISDKDLPEDGDVANLIYTMVELPQDDYRHQHRLENRLAMFLYNKTYEMLSFEQSWIVERVYDYANLCPFCLGGRKRRKCNCKNTGLIATRTIKLMANHIQQVEPPTNYADILNNKARIPDSFEISETLQDIQQRISSAFALPPDLFK